MRNERKTIRYSEAFKRQIISQLEDGTLDNLEHAKKRYDIRGASTVKRWVRQFGKSQLLSKVVRVETPGERDRMKQLEGRIRDLEHALAESRMRELLAEGYLNAFCEDFGVTDVEARKKKRQGGPSSLPPRGVGKGEASR